MAYKLYIGGDLGPPMMMDWYSDNGFAPRTSSAPLSNTSGLSGYAAAYAGALNQGATDAQAHDSATRATGGNSYTTFNSPGSGTTTYKTGDNPGYTTSAYKQAYEPKRSNYSNKNDFFKAANEYRLSLLNPYTLPGFYLEDGNAYDYVHVPEEGKSHSRDIVMPPTFDVDKGGNIVRTDHTLSGDINHTIFNLGGWRQTADGRNDPEVGDAYSRQISPYAAETVYKRGNEIGTTPSWYDPNARESWLESALAIARGSGGDYKSLLPGDDFYADFINGTSSGYGGGGGSSSQSNQNSLIPASDANITVNRPPDPAFYKASATVTDPEAMLRQQFGDAYVDALPAWQKQQVINAMKRLMGGV